MRGWVAALPFDVHIYDLRDPSELRGWPYGLAGPEGRLYRCGRLPVFAVSAAPSASRWTRHVSQIAATAETLAPAAAHAHHFTHGAVHFDHLAWRVAGLLMQTVDILRDQRVQLSAPFEIHERAVSGIGRGLPRRMPEVTDGSGPAAELAEGDGKSRELVLDGLRPLVSGRLAIFIPVMVALAALEVVRWPGNELGWLIAGLRPLNLSFLTMPSLLSVFLPLGVVVLFVLGMVYALRRWLDFLLLPVSTINFATSAGLT